MPTITAGHQRTAEVAGIIRSQIEPGVLMSLGASNLQHGHCDGDPALLFDVRCLTYAADGRRTRQVRKMRLSIQLTALDDYTIVVSYLKVSRGQMVEVIHERHRGIYASELSEVLLSIDSDDDRRMGTL